MVQPALTFQKPDRSWKMSLINQIASPLARNGIPGVDLTASSLLKDAQQQTQLSDWGDPHFRVALETLLNAFDTEARLNFLGRYFLRRYCLNLLKNRLQLQADFKHYPEIQQVPIQRPLFILGLPRTGTTFLHNLLSQDPNSRWLRMWELYFPVPAPEENDPNCPARIEAAQAMIDSVQKLAPKLAIAHDLKATNPEECNVLFEHEFTSLLFGLRTHIPSYTQWLDTLDWTPFYQSYRQQLQYLSWRYRRDHWVLKAPVHLLHLDTLLKVFPDANIVWNHRDPLETLPSVCSLCGIIRSIYTDHIDLNEIGQYWLNRLADGVESAIVARQSVSEEQFFDVNYSDLTQNPINTVRRIYDHFDYPYTPEMEQNINRWLTDNPQHKHGVHRYCLETFGLDAEAVNQRYHYYRTQFNV
ncbi:MAG: sulfotransferase [Microcoleaceae cyanobacterium]